MDRLSATPRRGRTTRTTQGVFDLHRSHVVVIGGDSYCALPVCIHAPVTCMPPQLWPVLPKKDDRTKTQSVQPQRSPTHIGHALHTFAYSASPRPWKQSVSPAQRLFVISLFLSVLFFIHLLFYFLISLFPSFLVSLCLSFLPSFLMFLCLSSFPSFLISFFPSFLMSLCLSFLPSFFMFLCLS